MRGLRWTLNRRETLGDRILKVNHAGEHGAVNIYRAQILASRLVSPGIVGLLREFQAHEERHRATFWSELQRRGKPRCVSYGLCGIGGWLLGFTTGLMGRRAVAATTVAVEHVVLRHLEGQLRSLRDRDAEACSAIESIVREEREHHDQAAVGIGSTKPWLNLLSPVVAASTELVIWIGMKA
jgi:ubiquinone biosynthesis monooxygenase Coq7